MSVNVMSLKHSVKTKAHELNISPQLVLQTYMMERLLERISLSSHRNQYIIKGGFLIETIVGIHSRATMDLDATLSHYPVTESAVRTLIEEIISIHCDDDVTFTVHNIHEIREHAEYEGYRVSLHAHIPPMSVPLKLDITTGDAITPHEIEYERSLMFEDRKIHIMGYSLPTLLAEKLETILSRGDQNTRLRDYYDVFILYKTQYSPQMSPDLNKALYATTTKRGTLSLIQSYSDTISTCATSSILLSQWETYCQTTPYASNISFKETCDAARSLMDSALLC